MHERQNRAENTGPEFGGVKAAAGKPLGQSLQYAIGQ
jgi:hypothetical protein